MSRLKTIATWTASVLMGLLFCMAGLPKIFGGPEVAGQFAGWGYPAWFAIPIGIAEVLGGLTLFIPRVARFGALLLMAVMAGALFAHVRVEEWSRLPFNLVLMVVLFFVFRMRGGLGGRNLAVSQSA